MLKTSYPTEASGSKQLKIYKNWIKTKEDRYKEELVTSFLSLIAATLRKYGIEDDDNIIIIWTKLFEAIETYDPTKSSIYTYMYRCIIYKTIDLKRRYARKKRTITRTTIYVDNTEIQRMLDASNTYDFDL